MDEPCRCGGKFFEVGGFGLDFCLTCGVGKRSMFSHHLGGFTYQDRIPGHQSYTRLKRFKKYLCRAMRQQSSCTVPRETWDYLLAHRPFRDTKHIQLALKRARHLKRKCYDSLPFLTSLLCPHINVPALDESEKSKAIQLFNVIDAAIQQGPFVSYLFCLEYILKKMGRQDVCQHVNKIQCPKRRAAYTQKLDKIFTTHGDDIMSQLRRHV